MHRLAATVKDIASKTGLGLATISSYLNGGNVREKNRVKIEDAIKELNFEVNEVARGLKTRRTHTIGVVLPELHNIFHMEIITEVEEYLRRRGYATMICDCKNSKELEKEAVEFLYRKRVDGIINIPVSSDGAHLESFIKNNKPVVLIDRKLKTVACDSVLVNNIQAAKEAVDLLIRNGHRRIGIIGGPEDIYTAQERMIGYHISLQEAGVEIEQSLIAHGNYTIKGGVECMKELIRRNPDMTAVFVINYEMTMGAVIGINELGLTIGENISMIGYDNVDFARATKPRLTIVEQPTIRIADEAARLMLSRLDGEHEENKVVKVDSTILMGKSIRKIG